MSSIHSYVVRYDSGFAPNPFYGTCTLATCKPEIRRTAAVGDWLVGCGSCNRKVQRGGHLVYAMCVTAALSFSEYDADLRFQKKKPFRRGSRKQSCGDNIYFPDPIDATWRQRDSFHSLDNGQPNPAHVRRDTGVDRVLISDHFVYFGGEGPLIPEHLIDNEGRSVTKSGIGRSRFDDTRLLETFTHWIQSLGVGGYQGRPQEWIALRG
jgi:hypothetical protein